MGIADEGLWANEAWEVGERLEQKFCFDHVKLEVAFEHLRGAIRLGVCYMDFKLNREVRTEV